jgi:hypothetical protein
MAPIPSWAPKIKEILGEVPYTRSPEKIDTAAIKSNIASQLANYEFENKPLSFRNIIPSKSTPGRTYLDDQGNESWITGGPMSYHIKNDELVGLYS